MEQISNSEILESLETTLHWHIQFARRVVKMPENGFWKSPSISTSGNAFAPKMNVGVDLDRPLLGSGVTCKCCFPIIKHSRRKKI